MNTPPPIDQRARQLHADALTHLSPQTLARLRAARQATHAAAAPSPLWRPRWALAGGGLSLVLLAGLSLGLLRQPAGPTAPSTARTSTLAGFTDTPVLEVEPGADDPYAVLEENPDLFVWLGSDSQPLAME